MLQNTFIYFCMSLEFSPKIVFALILRMEEFDPLIIVMFGKND